MGGHGRGKVRTVSEITVAELQKKEDTERKFNQLTN